MIRFLRGHFCYHSTKTVKIQEIFTCSQCNDKKRPRLAKKRGREKGVQYSLFYFDRAKEKPKTYWGKARNSQLRRIRAEACPQ